MFVRVEVATKSNFPDPASDQLLRKIELARPEIRRGIRWGRLLDVYRMEVDAPRELICPALLEIFQDRVTNWLFTGDLIPSAAGTNGGIQDLIDDAPFRWGKFWGLERHFRPGVTDNVGKSTEEAFRIVLGDSLKRVQVATGSLFVFDAPEIGEEEISVLAREVYCNELIESWNLVTQAELKQIDRFHPEQVKWDLPRMSTKAKPTAETVPLRELGDEELEKLSKKRLWALSLDEMKTIQSYFVENDRDPSDVEMEIFAQTWSEHCKHKIFNARIHYKDSNEELDIESLFKQTITEPTQDLHQPWMLSVFKDNAGIVQFDEDHAVCIKVETHNSPSALDPYGGALTGIVGVNRDILGCGLGAKPLFNTNVFCVAEPEYSQSLPERILHPRRILEGVRHGVEDGGNKSGIPTINGALVFDHRYLGKPLIYCGTAGILPRRIQGVPCEHKEIRPGDQICMVGGRIGKDGIHGATFSSLALDETSPMSAVQLGDPFTQKRVGDFLMEARDHGLYRTITDNGAGGLSSSVGELAQLSGGARMDVSRAKTKYPGLKPYELVVSESQERMTLAVPEEKLSAFLELAERRQVEVSVLGEFNDSSRFEIFYEDQKVADLNLEFLHDGLPKMELEATWKGTPKLPGSIQLSFEKHGSRRLLDLLARPNISSKEWLIRQYDHEVQGHSVVKPLHTIEVATEREESGPNDGGVIRPKVDSPKCLSVACGLNPKLAHIDPYIMAQSAMDEAIRNLLSVGTRYGRPEDVIALTDNFCWPDPLRDTETLGWLVRACFGIRDAALELKAPFVSGKDSMKNDYHGKRDGKDVRISAIPTLLVTALGTLDDSKFALTSDFKSAGDSIYLLGSAEFGLVGTELHQLLIDELRNKGGNPLQVVLPCQSEGNLRVARPDWKQARKIYRWLGRAEGKDQNLLKSIHDVSDGGAMVALAECLIGPGLGAQVEVPFMNPHYSVSHPETQMELNPDAQEERQIDPWEFAFGEGFHSFLVTVAPNESPLLETEWKALGVPFIRLGTVTPQPELVVNLGSADLGKQWRVSVEALRKAWKREGAWE